MGRIDSVPSSGHNNQDIALADSLFTARCTTGQAYLRWTSAICCGVSGSGLPTFKA